MCSNGLDVNRADLSRCGLNHRLTLSPLTSIMHIDSTTHTHFMKTWQQTIQRLAEIRARQLYQGFSEDANYMSGEIQMVAWIYECSELTVLAALRQELDQWQESS
jgi:hypothetical protein